MTRLPVECLALILSCLCNEPNTLHTLLSVDSVCFLLSVPLLYSSPFLLLEQHIHKRIREGLHPVSAKIALVAKRRQLARILLDSASFSAVFPFPSSTSASQTNDSLGKVHSSTRSQETSLTLSTRPKSAGLMARDSSSTVQRTVMTNYLFFYSHQYRWDLAFIKDIPAWNEHDPPWTRLDMQLMMTRYNPAGLRVFGVAMEPSLVQLIPNLLNAQCLTRLELYVITDESDIDALIEFVMAHDQKWGSIREIKLQGTGSKHDPVRLVQCLSRPRLVDLSEWYHPVAHLDRIASESLEALYLRTRERSPSEISPSFLESCRSLRSLGMHITDPDLFKPFVLERTDGGEHSPRGYGKSGRNPGDKEHGDGDRMPLSRINFGGEESVLATCLTDAVSAFQETLEEITAGSWIFAEHSEQYVPLAWTFSLPLLTRLDLQGQIVLAFDLDALYWCPSLRSLSLDLPALTHSVSGHKLASLASLTRLRKLSLEGKWYVGDHLLDYLSEHLVSLVELNLDGCLGPTSQGLLSALRKMRNLERYCHAPVVDGHVAVLMSLP